MSGSPLDGVGLGGEARDPGTQLHLEWKGLTSSAELRSAEAARIRSVVCQLSNRTTYSQNVRGSHRECVEGTTLGIISEVIARTGAPRGGLVPILNVHSTRLRVVLEDKRWPPKAGEVSQVLLNATLWAFLGSKWKAVYHRFRGMDRRDHVHPKDVDLTPEDFADLRIVGFAEDLVDYFFSDYESYSPPSYFHPSRREWNAAFDRRELGMAIRWTRRIVRESQKPAVFDPRGLRPSRKAYAAIFVPSVNAARKTLANDMLMTHLAFGPMETKGQFRVDILFPRLSTMAQEGPISREVPNVELFEPLWVDLDRAGKDAASRRKKDHLWTSLPHSNLSDRPVEVGRTDCPIPQSDRVVLVPEDLGTQTVPATSPALREIAAFMYLAYYYCEDASSEDTFSESLYSLRPHCPDASHSPFATKLSQQELSVFLKASQARYRRFESNYRWVRQLPENNQIDGSSDVSI
jgi:hypothetical protein